MTWVPVTKRGLNRNKIHYLLSKILQYSKRLKLYTLSNNSGEQLVNATGAPQTKSPGNQRKTR